MKIGLFIALFCLMPLNASEVIEIGKIAAGSVGLGICYSVANNMILNHQYPDYFTESDECKNAIKETYLLSDQSKEALLYDDDVNEKAFFWARNEMGKMLPFLVLMIAAARFGSWPKLGIEDLGIPLALGSSALLLVKIMAAQFEYNPDEKRLSFLAKQFNDRPSVDQQIAAGKFAHSVAYKSGVVLGAGIIGYTLLQRYKQV